MHDYQVERWTERGITTTPAPTKREANRIASLMRNDRATAQTVVIFPNGKTRVCRNPKHKAK